MPQLANVASPELLNSEWYAKVSICVARAAFAQDRALLMLPIDDDPARLLPLVDGVIAVDPMEADPRLAVLDYAGATIVTLDSFDVTRPHGRHVLPDVAGGVGALLDHLHAQGARNIAGFYPGIPWAPLTASSDAYCAWARSKGLSERLEPVDIAGLETIEAVHQVSYLRARELLAGPDRPDAVLALFGGFGVSAARAARDLGLRCPQDVLIAQDIDGAREQVADPSITAIDLRPDLQAEAAVSLLLGLLRGEDLPSTVTPVELRLRTSTSRSLTAISTD